MLVGLAAVIVKDHDGVPRALDIGIVSDRKPADVAPLSLQFDPIAVFMSQQHLKTADRQGAFTLNTSSAGVSSGASTGSQAIAFYRSLS
jgi:hypothetical protein